MKLLKTLLCFLSVFAAEILSAQNANDSLWKKVQRLHLQKADSAKLLTYDWLRKNSEKNDFVNTAYAHYWLGTTYLKGNLDSALAHAVTCLTYAEKSKQPVVIANAHFLYGSIYNRESKIDESLISYEKGLLSLKDVKDTTNQKFIEIYEMLLRGMSTSYNYGNKNDEALKYGLKALEIARRHHLSLPEMGGLIAVSSLFYKIEDYEQAKRYMHQALKKSIEENNNLAMSKCFANLAIFHNTERTFDSALFYIEKSNELVRKMNNAPGLINNLVTMSAIKDDMGKVKEAIAHLEEAEEIATGKSFDLHMLDILLNLSSGYIQDMRFAEALDKADQLVILAKNKKRDDKLAKAYKNKYKALSGLGKYKEATTFLEMSIAISDSLKNDENEKNLQQLLVKYETEKKEEEIKRITSEAEVKDLLIRQRNVQLISVSISVIVLIALSLLAFRNYRIKKEFELLDLQQRFYRAQINPHFLFNALGSVQGFFYDKTDPNKAAGYLSRLSKLMRQILENTFDNQVTLAEEKTLMENYLEIQKVRMGNRFDYEITMDDDLRDVTIPSMITQPFLENAVEHGFKELNNRKGKIDITISEENNMLQIKIIDNGTGLGEKKESSDHKSRAMDITWERLKLLGKTKKKDASFEVIDNAPKGGVGVTVLIHLPI